jgi:hypothetical protein
VDDDDCWTAVSFALHVGVQRELQPVDLSVRDTPEHAGDDVVAVRVARLYRGALGARGRDASGERE